MHFFISEERRGNKLILKEEEAKHFRVRRIGKNETFGVIYRGKKYLCKALKADKKEVVCEILEEVPVKIPEKEITLYQCVTVELKTMDLIVRQSTELGLYRLVPVISERSFRKLEAIIKRMKKWERIVREAIKQSGRAHPLIIEEPINLEDINAIHEENILLDNFTEGMRVKEINFSAKNFGVVVGPEGGFSKREGELLREKGFKSVLLEPYILRTETASIAILSVLINC
ncbi:16S rRNA (uracil(1498)-N(3))-methyltransferase [Aquifex pyrophilus]